MASSIWDAYIADASRRYGVPPALVQGVIRAESGGNPNAVSSAGASGMMQLMPNTFAGLGLGRDIFDPAANINGGAKYMRQMYDQFGNWTDAVGAYNAGPGAYMRVRTGQGRLAPETERYLATLQPTINGLPVPPPGRKPPVPGGLSPVEEVDIPSLSQPPARQAGGASAAPATQPGLLGSPGGSRTGQLLDEMDRMLAQGQGAEPPDRLGYALRGALQGVYPLMGPQPDKVSPWQVLAALGGGLGAGGQGYRQAQQQYRGQQLQDVGGRLKVAEARTAEEARLRQQEASVAFADQLDLKGHHDLAAAVRRNPSLMDEVLKAMAAGRFAKDGSGNFTLGPGQKRYDAAGNVITEVPPNPPAPRQTQHVTTADGVFRVEPDGSYTRIGASETAPDTEAGTTTPTPEEAQQLGLPPPPRNTPYSNPNLSPRGRSNLVAAQAKAWEKRAVANEEEVKKAQALIGDMERFMFLNEKVNREGVDTSGWSGGPVTSSVRGWWNPEIKEMVSIRDRIAPTLRQPGSGSSSDFDVKMFQNATVGPDKPIETNAAIAKAATQAARNLIAKAQFEQAYFDAYQHTAGMEAAWQKYLNDNPIFDPAKKGEYVLNGNRVDWQTYFSNGGKVPERAPASPEGAAGGPDSTPPPPPGAVVIP